MSIDETDQEGTVPTSNTPPERAQDDFVLRPEINRGERQAKKRERRLHLRAFDYWHALHGSNILPLFADLTAEGLLPFKRNSLLLDFSGQETIVRFCGAEMAPLLGGVLSPGQKLSSARLNVFAEALTARLHDQSSRQEAAEFEFIDGPLECRGILLPFSARGETAEFVMVVVNHRQKSLGAEEREKIHLEDPVSESVPDPMEPLADACKKAGDIVVHPGASTRDGLYLALSQAYRFHIEAARDPAAYRRFLKAKGLRQQQRAPFTPALKLTFGANYEKTRLTEYAAALSYAARHEVGPNELPEFLRNEPGGIKGCVSRERAFRRGAPGPNPAREKAMDTARELAGTDISDLRMDNEFGLVLVRTDAAGTAKILTKVDASEHLLDRAIDQAIKEHS
ncbi:MAG: hypothetical protein JJ850_05445 [Kordiimonadaceae bacterium]|nr:hypothetical protein [Kordiimonadaceae bacterium]MBO6568233.1 hypothetical protein [Kordiimonadaceae bacterium]MBO6964037.1 hypothetical protein [Kordiimonadaceae bacterium]